MSRRDALAGAAALLTGCRDDAPPGAAPREATVSLWLGGDVHLGADTPRFSPALTQRLRAAGGIVNLEGPVGVAPFAEVDAGTVRLASDGAAVAALAEHGVTAVTLANNHAGDRGAEGERLTRLQLKKAGILATPEAAWIAGSRKIVVSAHDLPSRHRPPRGLGGALARAAAGADWLVASFHVTGPPSYIPQPALRRAVDEAIRAGARVVVAHGTHALGPVERRPGASGDAVIAWGLGNLLFSCACTESLEGAIVRVELTHDHVAANVIPIDAGLMGSPARPAGDPRLALDLLEAIGSSPLQRMGDAARF